MEVVAVIGAGSVCCFMVVWVFVGVEVLGF